MAFGPPEGHLVREILMVPVLLGLLAAPGAGRATDLVDGVVAVVGEQPIMLSSVLFETEVRTVLSGGARGVNLGPPRVDCGVLEDLVDRAAVLQEAEGEIIGVDEQVARQLETFLDSFERVEDLTRWLARWRIGSAELRTHFASQLRAETFAAAVPQRSRDWIDAVRERLGVRYTDLGRDRLECGAPTAPESD